MKTPLSSWRALAVASSTTLLVVGLGTLGQWVEPDTTPTSAAARINYAETDALSAAVSSVAAQPASLEAAQLSNSGIAALARHAEHRARIELKQIKRAERLAKTPFSFVFAVFNILGSNHTAPGADADSYAPGRLRAEWAAQVAAGWGMDVIGFSEIQPDQLDAFIRTTGGKYDVWPGDTYGFYSVPASLAWDTSRFTATAKEVITIPFVGQQRQMPVVRLKESVTGREFWVINAHNAPQGRQGERDAAMAIEIAKIKELEATGLPVFFGGDLNEKTNAVCKVTSQTSLVAASPMGNYEGCSGWSGMRIDWLFGSKVTFSGYAQDRSALVSRITDHAVVVAKATVK
ncbi:MAG TPA: hypothetical protein VLI04_05915 [Nocardioidaceae bacterium]|nr:hypothetical protein [Nocardioidaceae bacterium]